MNNHHELPEMEYLNVDDPISFKFVLSLLAAFSVIMMLIHSYVRRRSVK